MQCNSPDKKSGDPVTTRPAGDCFVGGCRWLEVTPIPAQLGRGLTRPLPWSPRRRDKGSEGSINKTPAGEAFNVKDTRTKSDQSLS